MTEIENLRAELRRLRTLAVKVCWFDWSGNDPDAVAAIDDLRKEILADYRNLNGSDKLA